MKKEFSERQKGIYVTVVRDRVSYTYENPEDIKKVQEVGSMHYIMPTSEYIGEVIRNENKVIVELVFRKKE